jgi:uncharacterized membrane protein
MNLVKRIFLWLMGVFYVFAGAMHFWRPAFYVQIMPPYLPAHRELVELSGVAEFALGLTTLLLATRVPRLRRWTAWGIIALLVAVFPANLHVALNNVGVGGAQGLGVWNWVRLPFQALFIGWAWIYTRPDPSD